LAPATAMADGSEEDEIVFLGTTEPSTKRRRTEEETAPPQAPARWADGLGFQLLTVTTPTDEYGNVVHFRNQPGAQANRNAICMRDIVQVRS
jgi:hypothetical protein